MAMTRRALLGTGVTFIAAVAFGGVVRVLGGGEKLLRPPMVLDEDDFAARCIRCYRCISVCPTNAIVPATIEDGLACVETPKLDFHQGSCDFCNKCVEVCPTRAIEECDPSNPSAGRIGYAVVQTDRCLAYFGGCLECEQACPWDAITLDDYDRPVVNTDKCNGCGVCENICPALVYRSFSGGTRRGIVVVRNEDQQADLLAQVEV